ncbi:MAG: hypothetical protein P1V97_18705 [Planctomycetota bacterium]|nr:hypothetical protein [Planctomycetota bacterium]
MNRLNSRAFFTLLLIFGVFAPRFAIGGPDEEYSRIASRVKLREAEYPGKGNAEPSKALIAAFVKQRVALAQKLHKKGRLNDAILVLEGLSLYIPSIIEPRFDLAKLYYERILILKNQCQSISANFTEMAKAGRKEAAEAKLKELGKLQKIIVSDATKGQVELTKYLGKRPKDSRPADMLWRFYLMTGKAPKALQTLNKMMKETPMMDEARKQSYNKIRQAIIDQLKKPGTGKKRR